MLSVLLVSAPWGALDRPALGCSVLSEVARRRGHRCRLGYLGFDLADDLERSGLGRSAYAWPTDALPYESLAGEFCFADAAWGPDPDRDRRYVTEILHGRWGLTTDDTAQLLRIRDECTAWVERIVAAECWDGHDVIGFTSTFQQNLASAAIARRLAEHLPGTRIVFGGANWEGEMAPALLEVTPWIDEAISGEADESWGTYLDALSDRDRVVPPEHGTGPLEARLDAVPGLVRQGRPGPRTEPAPVEDLDAIPPPDFADFTAARAASGQGLDTAIGLLETARGCWWGARHHCTFCGLNGATLAFRSRRPDTVLEEIDRLTEQGFGSISVVDNILDMRYFRTVLPHLGRRRGPDLFWEIKANLSRRQVRQLADAGVQRVQPGIESLSDRLLGLMDKGVDRLQNLALLKWAAEYGVVAEWNVLVGVPGETDADYRSVIADLPSLHHLRPPVGLGPIRIDRFSPYHVDPAAHGLTLRPLGPYRFLYPTADDDQLRRLAYYFDHDGPPAAEASIEMLVAAVEHWRTRHSHAKLTEMDLIDDALLITDERTDRRRTARLGGWRAAVYRAADRPRSRAELYDAAVAAADPDVVAAADVDHFLDRCVAERLMVGDGDAFLGLAVHRPARRGDESAGPTRRRIELAVI